MKCNHSNRISLSRHEYAFQTRPLYESECENFNVTQTCPCNIQQFLKTVKMIILDDFFIFFLFLLKHRLWVHVRTASPRRF